MKYVRISIGQGTILQPHDIDLLNDIFTAGIRHNKETKDMINDLRTGTDLFDDYTDKELKDIIRFLREAN